MNPPREVWDWDYLNPSYWDKRSPLHNGPGFASKAIKLYQRTMDLKLKRHLTRKRGFKLDIGCGEGRLLKCASVGLDFSAGMLRRAKAAGRELVRADSQHLPFRDKAFDFGYSVDMMQHLTLEGEIEARKELKRVSVESEVILPERMLLFRLRARR